MRINRAAGGAKAECEVALVILRHTAHPPPGGVGLISAFLERRRHRSGVHVAQLEPSNACHGVGADCVIIDQRAAVDVAISVPEHQAVGNSVEPIRYAELWHAASGSWAERCKGCRGRTGEERKGRVGRIGKVHMKFIDLVNKWGAAGPFHKWIGSAHRWRKDAIEIGGEESLLGRAAGDSQSLRRGAWSAHKHLRPVKHKSLWPEERCARRIKNICGHVVAIWPNT